MEFKITSTYNDEKLVEEYPCLEEFGYYVDEGVVPKYKRILDEDGRNIRQVVYEIVKTPKIVLNSIEDIIGLIHLVNSPIIIDSYGTIEIYDGYRE